MFSANQDTSRIDVLLEGYQHRSHETKSINDTEIPDLSSRLAQRCFFAGDLKGLQRTFCKRIFIFTLLSLVVGFFISPILAVILLSLLIWLQLRKLDKLANQRARLFERDYTAFLLSFAASVRTGLDPIVAFTSCASLFQEESLVRHEVDQFKNNLDRGRREESALNEFASSIKHPDIKLLRSAVILARKQGSSLAECLQRLARITRQRQSFRRKIKAAIAMQRMSAIGISACAMIIAVIQGIANPEGVYLAIGNPIGQKFLGLGVLLMLLGMVWMLNLAKERV